MSPRVLTAVAVGLTLGASHAHALDPRRAPSQYVLAKWDLNAGLPSNGINALIQTRDHYLWLGTSGGLARFDGARFEVFNARNTPAFGDSVVSGLTEAADGALGVGTASAILRYQGGVFTPLRIPTGTGVVSSLLGARDGSLWVAMLGLPVHVWKDGRASSTLRQLRAMGPQAMVEDPQGAIWIGTRRDGLVRFEGGAYTSLGIVSDAVQALRFDHTGALWIGTPHGLYRWLSGHLTRFTKRDGLASDDVSSLLEDRDGNLWVGTIGGGLCRFQGGRWSALRARQGLADDQVRCLMEDHEGNLWVGTADGLNRLSDGLFTTYGTTEGLPDDGVAAVAGAADGSVWIGTASAGVARLRDGEVWPSALPRGAGSDKILAVHEDRDGGVWLASDNGRLFRIRGGVLSEQTPAGAPAATKVSAITEDEGGPLFYHTGFGLVRIQGRRATVVNAEVRKLTYVHALLWGSEGSLWLCSARGLARLKGREVQVYTTREGLPHNRVRSASVDGDGGLWLATLGGLAHFRDGAIRTLTTRQGLPENHLRSVLDDGQGSLWLTSAGLVFRIGKREALEVLAGRRPQMTPMVFDTADGLRTTESLLGSGPSCRDRQGRLWFATAKGVSVVDAKRFPAAAVPAPRVLFEGLTVDGRSRQSVVDSGELEYPAGRGEVTVQYTALSYRVPARLRFRHRLDGLDSEWVEAGRQRSAYYSNLPPGHYRFQVKSSDSDGVFGDPVSTLAFAIRPPFHRRPLFYVACAAALIGLALGAHRLHLGQVRSRFLAILEERTRIARELHDTLAQGIAGVGLQIEAAEASLPSATGTTRVRRHLHLAKAMVRSSLSEVRRSIWVLRAQTSLGAQSAEGALAGSLRQLTAEHGIALTLNVTGEPRVLAPEVERTLLRVAHEAVSNAVRHARAGTIDVALGFERDAVRLNVRDDGRGFDPSAVSGNGGGEHFGLQGMAERAGGANGELRIESQPGAGTRIECRLPYAS